MRRILKRRRRSIVFALLIGLLFSAGMLQSRPCDNCPVMNFGPTIPPSTGGTTCPTGRGLYKLGVSKRDITGPAAEVGMMGYADIDQWTQGIHMRLWSRAFAMRQCEGGRVLVFVSADLGQMFQSVHQGVMRKLHEDNLGGVLNSSNVILSATHTHNGPGGYSHRALYNLTTAGYSAENYNGIVDGIHKSVKEAYNRMKADKDGHEIYFKTVQLGDASFNRSSHAYMNNSTKYFGTGPHDKRDKTSRTLTFVRKSDNKITGLINWFGVHPTNIGKTNKLITGDSKGYASWKMEKQNPGMVAAFAQAAEGDMSPNFHGPPGSASIDFQRMVQIADKQFNAANAAKGDRSRRITGPIKSAMRYVHMPDVWVDKQYTGLSHSIKLCQPAVGFSMLSGSTEDGPGMSFIPEGFGFKQYFDLMKQRWSFFAAAFPVAVLTAWPLLQEIAPSPFQSACHAEKPIAIQTGARNGHPAMTEVHMPIMVAKVGQFTIIPVPFECTVTCGRILGTSIAAAMGSPAEHYAIAGLSNAYSGYVTTRQEYALQHYEGASVHYGPWTHAAYMQLYKRIANHLMGTDSLFDMPPPPAVKPADLRHAQFSLITPVLWDWAPSGWSHKLGRNVPKFGWLKQQPGQTFYRRNHNGVIATARFYSGHPRNDLKQGSSFLYVQRLVNGVWVNYKTDDDPTTTYHWRRVGRGAESEVVIKWSIRMSDPPGKYRIRHDGHHKTFWGQIYSYSGTSREFTVH